jgi:DNA segregation ATPase FtsK/SpoIIIE-like protein
VPRVDRADNRVQPYRLQAQVAFAALAECAEDLVERQDAVDVTGLAAQAVRQPGQDLAPPRPEKLVPALVIIVDEYAELTDEAPDAMSDTDSIARLSRAVAVTLVAATQRPTQKAMGQGAVRSQMDTRICFRVRERRDVDLVLGQSMLAAGWNAHTLNAPGKFLVSAPEHTTPRRARAYLVTDDDVARTVARYAPSRATLDDVSRAALHYDAPAEPAPWYLRNASRVPDEPGKALGGNDTGSLEDVLWDALCEVPENGADAPELMQMTGMRRSTVYKYLAQLAQQGRAVQVGWGRWRAADQEGDHGE